MRVMGKEWALNIIEMYILFICEIEYFVETHLRKLCVILRSRAYYGLCVLIKDRGRRLPLKLQCRYHGQQGDVKQSLRRNYKSRS